MEEQMKQYREEYKNKEIDNNKNIVLVEKEKQKLIEQQELINVGIRKDLNATIQSLTSEVRYFVMLVESYGLLNHEKCFNMKDMGVHVLHTSKKNFFYILHDSAI